MTLTLLNVITISGPQGNKDDLKDVLSEDCPSCTPTGAKVM